jgi:hypothetical protein
VNKIRKRLTYANVMSSIAVFLVLGGATAFAASKIGANQLKANSVLTGKIKKEAITTSKLKKSAVVGAKVKDGSLTGSDINLSTLGTVPSATSATTAANLAGQTPFFVRLGFGGSQTLAANGAVSFVATCTREGGTDFAKILEQTSVNGAVAAGDDDWEGGPTSADFLNPTTPANERELVENSETSGQINVDNDIDDGFIIGPEGKGLTTNTEGIALGLNYGAAGCLFAGVINAVG